jgi:septal ring factor EnvC (AmiA/AmiB activator)
MSSNAEEIALSNSFAGNRGRLPWPVEKGTISGTFGEHAPLVKNIKVRQRDGYFNLDGAKARTVFDGVVSSVMQSQICISRDHTSWRLPVGIS